MDIDERVKLRDALIVQFMNRGIIYSSEGHYHMQLRTIHKVLKGDLILNSLYERYVSDFRTEEEALYCLKYTSDTSEHVCSICGRLNTFYNTRGYRNTCGSVDCIEKVANSKEAKAKGKETLHRKYGIYVNNAFQAEECQLKCI